MKIKPFSSGSTGVLTFEVDRFLEDLVFYESASMSIENEVFGHAVLNLPALSAEGVLELRQHYIQLRVPLRKILVDEDSPNFDSENP